MVWAGLWGGEHQGEERRRNLTCTRLLLIVVLHDCCGDHLTEHPPAYSAPVAELKRRRLGIVINSRVDIRIVVRTPARIRRKLPRYPAGKQNASGVQRLQGRPRAYASSPVLVPDHRARTIALGQTSAREKLRGEMKRRG